MGEENNEPNNQVRLVIHDLQVISLALINPCISAFAVVYKFLKKIARISIFLYLRENAIARCQYIQHTDNLHQRRLDSAGDILVPFRSYLL